MLFSQKTLFFYVPLKSSEANSESYSFYIPALHYSFLSEKKYPNMFFLFIKKDKDADVFLEKQFSLIHVQGTKYFLFPTKEK